MENRKITTIELAKLCNVSNGTVDRALNNRKGISEKTKQHILETAKMYGYVPNIHARNLAGGKSSLVGILVFDLNNEYFSELITNIEKELEKQGAYPIVMFSHKDKQREKECLEKLINIGVDALIVCPVNDAEFYDKFRKQTDIPIVTVGNKVEGVKYVGIDNFSAMKELTEYVIGMGYKELIYYAPVLALENVNIYAQKERYRGFFKAAEESSIKYTLVTDPGGLKAVPEAAVIASTDYYAIKLMFSLGIKKDKIYGFDNINIIEKCRIPLTTVDCGGEATARTVAGFVLNPEDDETVIIPHKLMKA